MLVIIGTDGSEDAIAAATRGLELLATPDKVLIASVVDAPGEATAGMESGFAGGMVDEAEVERAWEAAVERAASVLRGTAGALDVDAVIEKVKLNGDAGPALCRLAEERGADAIVIGSRGRGAIKRALLGSVSQYVTNNAPCPVVVVRRGTDA